MTPAGNDAPDTPVTTGVPAPAESSPAANESTEIKIPTDPEGYHRWRYGKTEESPTTPKDREAPAPSKEDKSADGGEKPPKPDSETGDQQQDKQPQRRSAEYRLNELLADLKRAGFTPAELKTFKREATQQQPAPAAAKPAAPETTEKPPAAKEPPKLEDFKDWGEYRAAEAKYLEAQVYDRVQRALAEHLQRQEADRKMTEAKARYGDDAETYIRSTATAVFNDAAIPPVVKALLNESAVCADVLYVLGSDAKKFDDFLTLSKSNPGAALREIVLLEQLVQDELKKGGKPPSNGNGAEPGPERDESGKFVSSKPPPAAANKGAPPPAREVSGRAAAPPDASDAAFARGDFRAFREEENRRDLAARRGR